MKKAVLFLYLVSCTVIVSAQRFAYVDTDYVLENLTQYRNAQERLKEQTERWHEEILEKQEALTKTQAEFEAEKVLLTEEQIKEKELKITEEITKLKELKDSRYGIKGDLIKLRMALVKPIQDQVFNATKTVAEKKGYSFIFDKGSDLIMIYTDPKFDISRDVLTLLTTGNIEPDATSKPSTTKKPVNKRPSTTKRKTSR